MTIKKSVSALERLSLSLMRQAMQVEKLRKTADDIGAMVEEAPVSKSINYDFAVGRQDAVAKKIRNISWRLTEADGELQEISYALDALVDDLEELIPRS